MYINIGLQLLINVDMYFACVKLSKLLLYNLLTTLAPFGYPQRKPIIIACRPFFDMGNILYIIFPNLAQIESSILVFKLNSVKSKNGKRDGNT